VKGKERGKKDEETRSGDKVSPNGNNLMHLISQRMNLTIQFSFDLLVMVAPRL
jgi:hypothetical protein